MHMIRSLPWLVTRAVYLLSQQVFSEVHMKRKLVTLSYKLWARSIQPKFAEISVQNSMDRFGPTGKVLKKLVHFLRWTTFPGRTGRNFGRDPFNQNSNRSDREKGSTSKGGPVFSQLFRLDRTDPLSFGPDLTPLHINT